MHNQIQSIDIQFPATIWTIVPDPYENQLAVICRNGDKPSSEVSMVKLGAEPQWTLASSTELDWWDIPIALVGAHLVCTRYPDPSMPIARGIYVYHLDEQSLVWTDPQAHVEDVFPGYLTCRPDKLADIVNRSLKDGTLWNKALQHPDESYASKTKAWIHAPRMKPVADARAFKSEENLSPQSSTQHVSAEGASNTRQALWLVEYTLSRSGGGIAYVYHQNASEPVHTNLSEGAHPKETSMVMGEHLLVLPTPTELSIFTLTSSKS
ncbi:hypothetical protein [Pontibacter sp. G13]|uniref:hypothetical protein n=1 Tax=Pontibacter sp. G13 TaxID=3074898 RepID=UPI00288A08DF|nr:hypothetical protein [Pontibacter sp. G13]WNJ21121.1 hypothetical protein RJD25_11685 [Pontibacter sp. G13]